MNAEIDDMGTVSAMPLAEVRRDLTRNMHANDDVLHAQLATMFDNVWLREPPVDDASRWIPHTLGGHTYELGQPLTLTPYASAKPCSARCRFCSETLVDITATGPVAASLRPGLDYFDGLRGALHALRGVPLSYSLSGLENTDDTDWFLTLLDVLGGIRNGPCVDERVLYTNGAGLARDAHRLLPAMRAFGLLWIEWSRHHDNASANQSIMRFRPQESIGDQAVFEASVRQVAASLPVRLVCVLQRGGVESAADIERYIAWASTLGVDTVIFREFSALPAQYRANATRRYIDHARVRVSDILQACLDAPWFLAGHAPLSMTRGYYFWNTRWRQRHGAMTVVFEASDYGVMREHEETGRIYKLVYHANGNLCAGWQPERDVLWRAG